MSVKSVFGNFQNLHTFQNGRNGAETISWIGKDDFDYAIFVHYFGGDPDYPLIKTSAKATLYGNDGSSISISVPQEEPSPQSR